MASPSAAGTELSRLCLSDHLLPSRWLIGAVPDQVGFVLADIEAVELSSQHSLFAHCSLALPPHIGLISELLHLLMLVLTLSVA